jgi:uncharacterized membrane protein YfcA
MITALALGFTVGAILALTGAGGGILAVPLLIIGAHQSVAQAGPISLLAVGLAASLGAGMGLRDRIVRYRAALFISILGMLFSPLGLWLALRIDNRWLTILFALVLLLVAFRTFQSAAHGSDTKQEQERALALSCVRNPQDGRFFWNRRCARALGLTGCVAGLLSGLLGVGGGFVLVPALARFTDLDMKSVVATSLAVITLVSLAGVLSSIAVGNLNWTVGLPFVGGALAGMLAGRSIAKLLAGRHMQRGFALTAAMAAAALIVRSF